MGEFKPMVKMETTEPSIELKLKKGGSAHKKMKGDAKTGHKSSSKMADGGMLGALAGMPSLAKGPVAPVQRSRAPVRPSMAARRAAMAAGPRVPMKKGGKCYAEGGLAKSGIIKSESGKSTISTAERTDRSPAKTGDVKLGNGGGYKTGGVVKGNGGGYATGGVALGNAGGFKKGGSSKKAYANGGSVNNEGKAVSMPQGAKKPSTPVSINRLSGTFKKGGNVSSKVLQANFKKENAPALNASKAVLLDKYSPYQKKSGGEVESKAAHAAEMKQIGKVEKELKSHESMKASKAHKGLADGGAASDKDFDNAITSYRNKMRGQGQVSDNERRVAAEKRYPSGLTDSDIDRVINSRPVREGMTRFVDKKNGGRAK
jgi:hypothetical protein